MLSQQDTTNTYDLYSNFSSDGALGDEGNSRYPETKNFIYINPDLTKEEAKAAYDRRCHRRAQPTTCQSRVQVHVHKDNNNNSQQLKSHNTQHTPGAITYGHGVHRVNV